MVVILIQIGVGRNERIIEEVAPALPDSLVDDRIDHGYIMGPKVSR
jgi:hypothetical protein